MLFNKILTAIDFSDSDDHVIDASINLVKKLDASLYILHTQVPDPFYDMYESGPYFMGYDMAYSPIPENPHPHTKEFKRISEKLKQEKIKAKCLELEGNAIETILAEAKDFKADLILLGYHDHGFFYNLFHESVREGIINKSPCPIMIIPNDKQEKNP